MSNGGIEIFNTLNIVGNLTLETPMCFILCEEL